MKTNQLLPAAALAVLLAAACVSGKDTPVTYAGLNPEKFTAEVDGKPVALYLLKGSGPVEVAVTNYGGRIAAIQVPDRDGILRDVVLGFDSIQSYFPENNASDFGASIGRYANRIGHGKLPICGDTIQLPTNNFGHTLHGGPDGWQYKVYSAEQPNDSTLVLSLDSPDGDNAFPGNVHATVTYTLQPEGSLDIDYRATTDKPTVVNMTNHSYFNLSGNPAENIDTHTLYINALGYTPVDSTYMTTGETLPVKDTPMDFTTAKPIGRDVDNFDYVQLKYGNGYDHNWDLAHNGNLDEPVATLYCPATGIAMDVYTDEPGMQVYTANFLDGSVSGKRGIRYGKRAAICLETQHFPDSPNKPKWPSTLLLPGDTYKSHTAYHFYIQ